MFNPRSFFNSRPDGFGVFEVAGGGFAPLTRTELAGTVTGPMSVLKLTQTFAPAGSPEAEPVEAVYRFPLPGDAAVTGVRVAFGEVEIRTTLKERQAAEAEYAAAKATGRQGALLTRESPDVFTLAVSGLRPGQVVKVETEYVQLARPEGGRWSLRVPLTTAPRYVRADEAGSRHAAGQPLAVLRDPGHRFALDIVVRGAERVTSSTHELAADGGRVRLAAGEVVPDRDFVLTWTSAAAGDRPALAVWTQPDSAAGRAYFLALCTPPSATGTGRPREVILLVDHSGSMQGAKWEAADWAVERFLAGLTDRDTFALGVFHTHTRWFAAGPQPASPVAVEKAVAFLKASRDDGGTELGVALEQSLGLPRAGGALARHVLVITDAEVTDAGRLLQMADREMARGDRRRVSVLCIDAAPNAALATELAERGGGVSRFLTSDPNEDDVTTALDEVLADWAAPVVTGLTLEVNRPTAETVGRLVSTVVPGPSAGIDVGDLPAGRPVWVAGRAPLDGPPLTFRLRAGGPDVVAECTPTEGAEGLAALFGAYRLRRLEYLMSGGASPEELLAELRQLGVEPEAKTYAENARGANTDAIRGLLIRESLAAGLPCSETAFVATRNEAGRPVTHTVVVANALPAGWSEGLLGGMLGAMPLAAAMPMRLGRVRTPNVQYSLSPDPSDADAETESIDSMLVDFDAGPGVPSAAPAAGYGGGGATSPAQGRVRIVIAAGQFATAHGAVLFDSDRDPSDLPPDGRLTFLASGDPTAAEPGWLGYLRSMVSAKKPSPSAGADSDVTILVYVGDLSTPRARVRLADLLRPGGRRPLNIRRSAGQVVRLALEDAGGAWAAGVPAIELTLGWGG